MFSSLGKSDRKDSAKKPAGGKADEALEAERAAALQTISAHEARIKKPMEQYHSVANSQYWRYGYMGGTLLSAGAVTFAISSKFPAFASVGSLGSLALGMMGGPKLHEFHVTYLRVNVAKQLDPVIADLEKADQEHGARVPAYRNALTRLRAIREEVLPAGMNLGGLLEGGHQHEQKATDLDGRVDEILAAYGKRRGTMPADAKDSKA